MNLILSFLAKNPYTTALHCQPRAQQAENFSKTRLTTAISESKYLSNWVAKEGSQLMLRKFEKPNKEKKKIEYNYYALTGIFASGGAESGDSIRGLSTDLVAFDEAQDMDGDALPTILEGMSHSNFKHKLILGTPKFTHDTLWKNWESSDKKEWFVHCDCCDEDVMITYDTILDDGSDPNEPHWYYGCPKCGKELNRRLGFWKPTNTEKSKASGYHLTQLIVPWITAGEIKEKEADPNYSKRRFMNEVLGLAYVGDDLPITESKLIDCSKGNNNAFGDRRSENLYVGCDWGKNGSYCTIVDNKGNLVDLFSTHDKDSRKHPMQIASFLKTYKSGIRRIVVDFGPDLAYFNNMRDFCRQYGIYAPVYACKYMTPPQSTEEHWNENDKMVNVGRSEIIEVLIDMIDRQKLQLPRLSMREPRMRTFITHCCNIASELNSNNSGNQFIQFISLGDDHYLHSTIYALLATKGAIPNVISSSVEHFVNPRKDRTVTKKHSNTFMSPIRSTTRVGRRAESQRRVRKGRR